MKKILCIAALCAPLTAHAGRVFLEIETAMRSESPSLHAAGIDSPLGAFAVVYEPSSMGGRLAIFARHTSSIPRVDDHGGLNEIGIRARIEMD